MITRTASKGVTQEQLDRCTRCMSEDGRIFYRVTSERDPDTTYTLHCKWLITGACVIECNCLGYQSHSKCKHRTWVRECERLFQEATMCYVVSETKLTDTMHAYFVRENGNDFYVISCRTGVGCECDQPGCAHEQCVRDYETKQATQKRVAA